MANFSKIYDHILDSTLWEEIPEARLVLLGMAFASDLDGKLFTRTKSALARRLNLTEDYIDRGLAPLLLPDPNSANKEYDGRRVVPIDGGWLVVSKSKYVGNQSSEQAKWAEKKARWRAKRAAMEEGRQQAHSAAGMPQPRLGKREAKELAKLEEVARMAVVGKVAK